MVWSSLVRQELVWFQAGGMTLINSDNLGSRSVFKVTACSLGPPLDSIVERPHVCSFPSCNWSFVRISDLRRHAKSHTRPKYQCPFWLRPLPCHRNGGSFNRLDVLKRHLKLVHYVRDHPPSKAKLSVDDLGWCSVCQRIFDSSLDFLAHCLECANQRQHLELTANPDCNT